MKGHQFAHIARLAERVKEVFGVVTVIEPNPRRGLDQAVDGGKERAFEMHVMIDAVDFGDQIGGQRDGWRGQEQHLGKARRKMVAQGGVHLDRVFGEDHGDGPFGEGRLTFDQKLVEREIMHRNPQV